jgi:putative DNA-invertase from lambdoid prophage Rac
MAKKIKNAEQQAKVIGYARISTDRQETDRQRLDIQKYTEKNGLPLTRVIEEKVSSRQEDREIYKVIAEMGKGDILIVTELSRLARSMIELNQIIGNAISKGISIKIVTNNKTIDDSIESQAFVFAFGIGAQVERDLISERTKSALQAKKAQGVKLGRPEGKGNKVDEVIENSNFTKEQVLDYIKAGLKAEAIRQLLGGGLDIRTVRAWMATHKRDTV